MVKAMDLFDLDPLRWSELAADRVAWREMLHTGTAPAAFRAPPPAPVPMPISHFLVRPRRAAAAATMSAITDSLATLSLSDRSGELRGGEFDRMYTHLHTFDSMIPTPEHEVIPVVFV